MAGGGILRVCYGDRGSDGGEAEAQVVEPAASDEAIEGGGQAHGMDRAAAEGEEGRERQQRPVTSEPGTRDHTASVLRPQSNRKLSCVSTYKRTREIIQHQTIIVKII